MEDRNLGFQIIAVSSFLPENISLFFPQNSSNEAIYESLSDLKNNGWNLAEAEIQILQNGPAHVGKVPPLKFRASETIIPYGGDVYIAVQQEMTNRNLLKNKQERKQKLRLTKEPENDSITVYSEKRQLLTVLKKGDSSHRLAYDYWNKDISKAKRTRLYVDPRTLKRGEKTASSTKIDDFQQYVRDLVLLEKQMESLNREVMQQSRRKAEQARDSNSASSVSPPNKGFRIAAFSNIMPSNENLFLSSSDPLQKKSTLP